MHIVLRITNTEITQSVEEEDDIFEKTLHIRHIILKTLVDIYETELSYEWMISEDTKRALIIQRVKDHINHMYSKQNRPS